MPTAGGPNTLGESNLVFAYDTGDVKNSYIGEPTTNVATGTLTPYTPYNTMTRSGQDLTITMVGGSALYLTFHNGTDYNGQTITLSGYMFKNGIPHTLPNNRANTYHTVAASKWYFDSVTGYFEIVEVCNASSIWLFHTPSGASGGDVITILDFQVEVKTHATPFVNGARSATQGLLPLIGNSTIDLSNVSFDSSAKMTFDGTNDYINVPYNTSHNLTSQGTVSAWINPATVTQGNFAGIVAQCTGGSANQQAYQLSWRQVSNAMYGAICNGSGTYDQIFASLPTVANVWYNIVFTWNGSQLVMYNNGVVIGTATQTINNQILSTDLTIGGYTYKGAGGSGEAFNGKIDKVELYNRALTAQEVKQNYQQYKTRFNLS